MSLATDPSCDWYHLSDTDLVDSPALLIYPTRVVANINRLVSMIDDVQRLRPHVKTHKTKEATLLMMQAGIQKFKCATISEAEMLAMVNAPDVLLAYQPLGPKLERFIGLAKKYPSTRFSCLVDNAFSAGQVAKSAKEHKLVLTVYLDLNVGMNRTGIIPGNDATTLYEKCSGIDGISIQGLHAYDGHIRNPDFAGRVIECNKVFAPVQEMQQQLVARGFPAPVIIAGGSPTFPIHAQRKEVECSPGTFIFWDQGYSNLCPEQHFDVAALVISRVISLPDVNKICLDLGHKSISAENDLQKRVHFLNAPELTFIGHSEEHLVAESVPGHSYKVGDVLYGIPFHICPTVALYERGITVEDHTVSGEWKVIARDRKLNV
jgi:D-threonine aldolase